MLVTVGMTVPTGVRLKENSGAAARQEAHQYSNAHCEVVYVAHSRSITAWWTYRQPLLLLCGCNRENTTDTSQANDRHIHIAILNTVPSQHTRNIQEVVQ